MLCRHNIVADNMFCRVAWDQVVNLTSELGKEQTLKVKYFVMQIMKSHE